MNAIRLKPPLDRSLAAALEIIGGAIPDRELRLGGGSALAAMWDHRLSTDIDLVCRKEVFERTFDRDGRLRLRDRLRSDRSKGMRISAIRVAPGIVGWTTATGPVSLVPSRLPDSPELWSDHTVEGTGVRLASVAAVLRGKMLGRLLTNGVATDRDGYDFAVALLKAPDAARGVMDASPETRGAMLAAMADAAGKPGAGRSLLRPAYETIAADPWGEALRILERGLVLADYERRGIRDQTRAAIR